MPSLGSVRSSRAGRPAAAIDLAALNHKALITFAEAEALGFGSVDTLRDKVASGDLVKSVVKIGFGDRRQHVRFVRDELLDELRECS